MKLRLYTKNGLTAVALAVALPAVAFAQTPVDDDGNPVGSYQPSPASVEQVVGNEDIPLLSGADLQELVGPIALYPDDLLAIVLPASAYPLQIVEAARFLEELKSDSSLQPDPEWDDSVVALLNYPEIIEHLNEDIDWTWRLGEAVVAQQTDVVEAIEQFRDRAYAAGNLKSDSYQNVTRDDGVIEITPVSDDVIYVPYYEPERVVVYQPRPVYYYYPRSYPVYYYPYSSSYHFDRGYFWGVTTAFTIGWLTDSLHVYHHSYHGHPYYGWSYRDRWWYRRPSINVYNTTYVNNTNVTINRYYEGDSWRPRHDRRDYVRPTRVTRNWNYQPQRNVSRAQPRSERRREPVTFRERRADQRDTLRRERAAPQRQARLAERPSHDTVKRRESPRHIQPERGVNRESRAATPRETRRKAQPAPQRDIRRESRPTPQRDIRRESRPTPHREVRRESRPAPQREIRRESRQAPQRQVRRESRPAPQREVRRESRPAPQREVRRETRPAPRKAESKRRDDAPRREERRKRR